MNVEEQEIREVILLYANSLSGRDAANQASHFTEDGMMMADGHPTVRGRETLKHALEGMVAKMVLKFELEFEHVSLNEGYAVAITASNGTAELKDGGSFPIQNRAMWLMEKEGGVWRISKYIYNTTG